MKSQALSVALIKGDGIGVDIIDAGLATIEEARRQVGGFNLGYTEIQAGAAFYAESGIDIEPDGEKIAGESDAIFLGAIGLPSIRHTDGTEISPHLRIREKYQLYAGVRPVKAYPNAPQRLADPKAANIDFIILRESTEGLFYSAAVHGRSIVKENEEVLDTLKVSRSTTEKLHRFAFRLAAKRKTKGFPGRVTCVDKANVFNSMAFFRQIFDEIALEFPEVDRNYNYVDAQALELIRRPWKYDVLVMENMFGDILSDLAGGLVGGMGIAACGEIGDHHALFQPAHGSAPDLIGQDKANPLATILSGALMLEYLSEKKENPSAYEAAELIRNAIDLGFAENRIRPIEFGGDMGTNAITEEVLGLMQKTASQY